MISRDDPHTMVSPSLVLGLGGEIEERGALLLAPAEPFGRTAAALAAQGFRVQALPGAVGGWVVRLPEAGTAGRRPPEPVGGRREP